MRACECGSTTFEVPVTVPGTDHISLEKDGTWWVMHEYRRDAEWDAARNVRCLCCDKEYDVNTFLKPADKTFPTWSEALAFADFFLPEDTDGSY